MTESDAPSGSRSGKAEPHAGRVIWTLLGGVVGAALVLFLSKVDFRLTATMDYDDLAAVLLSAVGVIVAVFGVGLAILAFWGFSQLRKDSVNAAVKAAEEQVDRLIRAEIASPEMKERIIGRVDEIVLGSSLDRELDSDLEDEGSTDA